MKWSSLNAVVEFLRQSTLLYLPALTERRGFSSSRVEHLLNQLVATMPASEAYLEVGTLEGRTLEAAAVGNETKMMYGADPCEKYATIPDGFPPNVQFYQLPFQELRPKHFKKPLGLVFYDADHSSEATAQFMIHIEECLAKEAVLVLDDWDRSSVRRGAFNAETISSRWRLLREMPEYGDGLTVPCQKFGYSFGVSVWGFRR